MGILDRFMDALTRRRLKLTGAGHAPGDTQPDTGSDRLSDELEADFGADTAHTSPEADADAPE